ncbi:MAG: hypothetical protein U0R44_03820 [Candidatus Micrarchaeia archaeon]
MMRQKRLPTTRPEMSVVRKEPVTEPCADRALGERDTLPSMPKNGVYSIRSERKKADIPSLISDLQKKPEARPEIVRALKKAIDTLDKARDALSLLPPDDASNAYLTQVRAHCISLIRKAK